MIFLRKHYFYPEILNNMSTKSRYSDSELEEFRVLIEKKLDKTRQQLEQLYNQIKEITENADDGFGNDWFDDSSTNTEVDYLSNMTGRQEKYLQSLEAALLRIQNKTFGICTVTGELIDKNRLKAVPTTTKTMEAKLQEKKPTASASLPADNNKEKRNTVKKTQIISKVIKKANPPSNKNFADEDELKGLDEEHDLDVFENEDFDLQDIDHQYDLDDEILDDE